MTALSERRVLLIVVALAALLYAPSVANGFAMDDLLIAKATLPDGSPDPVIHGLHAPWWYFGQRYWAGTENTSVLYRPVTILTYALTYNLVGAALPAEWEALPQHLVNVVLHALAVWLVWRWLTGLGAAAKSALIAAGCFAVLGIHSEAVAGVVGRAEVLALVFGLAALLAFDRGRTALAGSCLFLSFCSKESALAWAPFLPCHLLARAWLAGRTDGLAEIWRRHGRAVLLAVVPAIVAFFALRHFATSDVRGVFTVSYEENPLAYADLLTRWFTAVYLAGVGLLKCVVPTSLSSLYGPGVFPLVGSPAHPGFLTAALGLGAWLAAALVWRRRAPLLFLSACAFFGFLFLVSNLPFAIGTIFAERLYYQPSLGVCLVPAALLASPRLPPLLQRSVVAALLVGAVGHAAVVVTRNGVWRDNTTLFLTDAERLPQSADLQAKAGYVLIDQDPDRAMGYFERCVAVDPDLPGAWASIARIHERRGNLELAEQNYRRALQCRHVEASGTQARTVEDLVRVLLARKQPDQAIEFCRTTLQQLPGHYFARLALLDLTYGKVAPNEMGAMLMDAVRRFPEDARIRLREAIFAHDVGQKTPAELTRIAQSLASNFARLPEHERRDAAGIRAQLYLGEIYVALGQKAAARPYLQGLLQMRELSPQARERAQVLLTKAQ